MDEILSAVLRGFAMVTELETNLSTITQHPVLMRTYCEEIAASFASAAQRLQTTVDPHEGYAVASAPTVDVFSGRTSATDVMQVASTDGPGGSRGPFSVSGQVNKPEVGGVEVSSWELGGSSSRPTIGSSAAQSTSRKRKEMGVRRIVKAPAPPTVNLDVPPDDGHTWRKYGQKDILGTRFPRSYYRCTHKSFYGCEAKKKVQRLDEDPLTYEITYVGEHTCQATAAPLTLPAITPVVFLPQETSGPLTPSSSFFPYLPATTIAAAGTSVSTTHTTGMTWLGNPPGSEMAGGSGVPGSFSQGRRDGDNAVVDLVNIMFSSAESVAASVDSIFHSKTADDRGC